MLRDIRRLISFLDVLYYVGDQLYKRSLRYTGVTAAVSLVGYLGNFLPGVDTYTARVAIALPLMVGSASLVGGVILRSIPSLLALRAMNVAQAQDLDLMEDYRKSRQEEHLQALWERVFRAEWGVGSAASRYRCDPVEAPLDICFDSSSPRESVERGRCEFLARARFALARPQPQTRQRYYLGLDLRFLEDWRNGAYFDRSDAKLIEQFDGSATLEVIKREVGYDRWAALRDFPMKFSQRFWFLMITRAIAIQVGDAITWLNRQYSTDLFNAQAFLWPGEEDQPWLRQFPGGAEELRERRGLIVERIFGRDWPSARRMLDRIVLPSFRLATGLRARYDPEYLDGSLGYDVTTDLEQAGVDAKEIEAYRRLARRAMRFGASLTDWLNQCRPEMLDPENTEALRAARIATHVRRRRLRKIVLRDANDVRARRRFVDEVLPIIEDAACKHDAYSSRLVALRLHHELTRLHHQEYLQLLKTLRDGASGEPRVQEEPAIPEQDRSRTISIQNERSATTPMTGNGETT